MNMCTQEYLPIPLANNGDYPHQNRVSVVDSEKYPVDF